MSKGLSPKKKQFTWFSECALHEFYLTIIAFDFSECLANTHTHTHTHTERGNKCTANGSSCHSSIVTMAACYKGGPGFKSWQGR